MDNKYLNEVLDRLENYQKMMRQLELLQYEIQYASHVTPTEMIEVMTFQKRDADNAGTNAYPKSVPEIAMSYQRTAAQLNGESVEELISKYADLCREQDRLSHYIGFLDGRQQDVIRRYYFEQQSWGRHGLDAKNRAAAQTTGCGGTCKSVRFR